MRPERHVLAREIGWFAWQRSHQLERGGEVSKDMAKETVVVRDMKGKSGGERDKRKECEVVRDIKGKSGSERHRDIKGKSVRW